MPIVTHKLGPGLLSLGAGPLDVSAQLTACKVSVSETVDAEDDVKVLSGDTLEGDESASYDYTLTGTFLQSLAAGAVVDWSWINAGTEQPFRFVPNTAADRQVEGTLTPVPLEIGGDEVDKRMSSTFTWRIKGTPDFEAAP